MTLKDRSCECLSVESADRKGLTLPDKGGFYITGTSFALFGIVIVFSTASVVYWSEFLATDTEVPGSIPGATRFSE